MEQVTFAILIAYLLSSPFPSLTTHVWTCSSVRVKDKVEQTYLYCRSVLCLLCELQGEFVFFCC